MTIGQALSLTDAAVPNSIPAALKRRWIDTLERLADTECEQTRADAAPPFAGYAENAPDTTVLRVGAPYDDIYPLYLEMRIHQAEQEPAKADNAAMLFSAAWASYSAFVSRTRMPKCPVRAFRLGGVNCGCGS